MTKHVHRGAAGRGTAAKQPSMAERGVVPRTSSPCGGIVDRHVICRLCCRQKLAIGTARGRGQPR